MWYDRSIFKLGCLSLLIKKKKEIFFSFYFVTMFGEKNYKNDAIFKVYFAICVHLELKPMHKLSFNQIQTFFEYLL